MNRRFLPEPELRRIAHHARHVLPRAYRPDEKSSAVDPRCVGSRLVQASVELGHGRLFQDHGGANFTAFPQTGRLAGAMEVLFPALGMNRSLGGVSSDIISANDRGDFDHAWDKVEQTIGREGRVRRAKVRAGELDLVGVN